MIGHQGLFGDSGSLNLGLSTWLDKLRSIIPLAFTMGFGTIFATYAFATFAIPVQVTNLLSVLDCIIDTDRTAPPALYRFAWDMFPIEPPWIHLRNWIISDDVRPWNVTDFR